MGILRLSHVEVRVPDLELATAYYTEVLGLVETAREDGRPGVGQGPHLPEEPGAGARREGGTARVFLKCWDEHQHHSVILRFAPTYGLEHMGFKVEHEDDLAAAESLVESMGSTVKRFSPGELAPGHGAAVRFDTPSGHVMELVFGMQQVGNMLPRMNPAPRPQGLVGIAPPRVDHVFLTAEDVDESTEFFQRFGFRLTEQILARDGHQLATFLERSHTPHDIAFVTGPNGGLHHFAFWLDDWNEVRTAADTLAYHGVPIDVGPTRHGVTRGYTIYFFDPVGNRNEVFTGGYWVDPDFETITWTEEQMGRAIFYYEGQVNDRFFTVHS